MVWFFFICFKNGIEYWKTFLMAAWNVFCLCDTACPPDQCWLSAVLPELQGLGDLLNEFLEQSMTLKSFSNFVVTSVAGSASHLTSQLVSIIHPMAQVIRWSCCPDVSRLTGQNSNTPGLGCPRCKLRLQSHPVAKDLNYWSPLWSLQLLASYTESTF